MKRKDLTGNQYGELTVLKFSRTYNRSPMYLCKCTCGKEKEIHGYALENGHYKSCGCMREAKRDRGLKKHIQNDCKDGTRKSALIAKVRKDNKSGVKGVIYLEDRKKWKAYIGIKGKSITLGYFSDKVDAINARKAAEEKYHDPYKN